MTDSIQAYYLNFILHVLFPILLGGLIYVAFRDTSLTMFYWFQLLQIEEAVFTFRELVFDQKDQLPNWVLYSVPDGAWVWSMTSAYTCIWKNMSSNEGAVWIGLGIVLGLGGEFGQLVHWVPGTFDVMDLVVMCCAFIIPYRCLSSKAPNA